GRPGQQSAAGVPGANRDRSVVRTPAVAARAVGIGPVVQPGRALAVGLRWADDEVDLDAVAHDPAERLGDQRAVARLQPVLGEAVRHRDAEARVVDLDERGVTQPGLEVRGRESDLELAEGGAPDLLRVHKVDVDSLEGRFELVAAGHFGQRTDGSAPPAGPGRRGFGWRNIAPPRGRRKVNSRYSPGVLIRPFGMPHLSAPDGSHV